MSDLHFSANSPVQGIDTETRIRSTIDYIGAHYSDAACCVISGDLADRGTQEDYAALARLLGDLPMPVYPMVGNHDDRALVRQHFSLPDVAMPDFVQYAVTLDDVQLLCLDSLKEGSDRGQFCRDRKDWLAHRLREARGKQVLLFMHHPPFELGLPMQDPDSLENGGAFVDVLEAHPGPLHLCLGHVHRPISGSVHGIPFTTMRAVSFQAPPPRPAWDWSNFSPANEAPNLGVILASQGAVAVQYQQFCTADHAFLTS